MQQQPSPNTREVTGRDRSSPTEELAVEIEQLRMALLERCQR